MGGNKIAWALAIGAVVQQQVDAACPNACSGHGVCGQHDACECYPDWGAGDCSQRFCPSNWAWITTNAHGDLNSDGNRDGVTVYDTDHYFLNSGLDYIVTQNEPQGSWESWPAFMTTAGIDEGHFYMECSNMGICDRALGQCQCFEGYTGSGCRRSQCPNDCSGHGVCKTVAQQAGSFAYKLWDKDMSRSCVCDAGYSGPDCAERKCGYGDDPLTVNQVNEKQWIDIWSDMDAGSGEDRSFAGTIKVTFTDYNGNKWTTDSITVAPHTTGTTSVADALETALNSFPDDVLSGVTVTQGYAERPIPGTFDTGATITKTSTFDLSGLLFRCPEDATDQDTIVYTADGSNQLDYDATTAITLQTLTGTTCNLVDHFWSLRLEVNFNNNPGNLPLLEVDISGLTTVTKAADGSSYGGYTVHQQRKLAMSDPNGDNTVAGGSNFGYTHPDNLDGSCTGASGDLCGIASGTITVDATLGANVYIGARVKLTCDTKVLGTFTIDTIPSATTFTVVESIPDCTITAPAALAVEFKNWRITTNVDLTGVLSGGEILSIDTFSGDTGKVAVGGVKWDNTVPSGYIILESEHVGALGNKDETGGDVAIYEEGDATSEGEECSARGICNRETGICSCFKGYTGWACSLQNALSAEGDD